MQVRHTVLTMDTRISEKIPRMHTPGLDALRGIAVIIGWLYHTHLGPFGSGFLFVDVFGVLSGYLITSLLLREIMFTDSINLKQFYLRRSRRLAPALLLTICAVVLYSFVMEPNILGDLRLEIVAILFYVYNWYILVSGGGYFHEYSIMPLRHTWTLSIEEQFYIILPLVLLVTLVKLKLKSKLFPYFLVVLATLSAALSAFLYFKTSGTNVTDMLRGDVYLFNRKLDRMMTVYMSTFTRAGGFLVGTSLAFWWKPDFMREKSARFNKTVDFIGVSSIALILVATNVQIFTKNVFAISLGGGVAVVWLLCVGGIIGLTRIESRWTQTIFVNKYLTWLGVRAYGLYLFTWPVAQFHRKVPFKTIGLTYFIVSGVITIIAADLSYRYFENPIRKYGVKAWFNSVFTPRYRRVAFTGGLVVLLGVAGILVTAPPTVNTIEAGVQAGNTGVGVTAGDLTIVAIGDSTVLGASDALARVGITADAERMRGAKRSFDVAQLVLADKAPDVLVMHVGNMGDFDEKILQEYIAGIPDNILIVLVSIARKDWKDLDRINKAIYAMPSYYTNVVVYDWQTETRNTADLLEYDGVHMTEAGRQVYAQGLRSTIDMYYK